MASKLGALFTAILSVIIIVFFILVIYMYGINGNKDKGLDSHDDTIKKDTNQSLQESVSLNKYDINYRGYL